MLLAVVLLSSLVYGALSLGDLYEPSKPFTGVVGKGLIEGIGYAEIKLVNNDTNINLIKEKFETALKAMGPELSQDSIVIDDVDRFWSDQDEGVILVLRIKQMELPHDVWMRDTIFTRVRSSLMNQHHSQMYDGVHHVELQRFQEGIYKWKTPDHPHIMFVVSDDQGYQDVGFHNIPGKPNYDSSAAKATPNIDAIRAEGVEVAYYYTYPICSPSRTAIWTGRFTYRHGYGPSINNGNTAQLSGRETLWSEVLKGVAGYYQMAFEKWHLGNNEARNHPLARGFDAYMGPFSLNFLDRTEVASMNPKEFMHFYCSPSETEAAYTIFDALPKADVRTSYLGKPDEKPLLDGISTIWNKEQHNVNILLEKQQEAMQNFIKSDDINNSPLHMYIGSRMPHDPIDAPIMTTPFGTRSERAKKGKGYTYKNTRAEYLGMVYAMDMQVGELVQTFKDYGMWKDTVFIFMSDNPGIPNFEGSNLPLQGRKNLVWDMRVVNVWHGSASTKAPINFDAFGSTNYDLMHSVDLFKTITTGIVKIPEEQYTHAYKCPTCLPHNHNKLDGMNQWPSIITNGGIDHIQNSKRMFVTHVISKEQIKMQTATDKEMEEILPRSQWDESFWKSSRYKDYVGSMRQATYNTPRALAREFGTGYIQYGRYAFFFQKRGSLGGDPSLNPSDPAVTHGNIDKNAYTISFLLGEDAGYGLPSKIPGHDNIGTSTGDSMGYFHDVWGDPEKFTNILKSGEKMSIELKDTLATMLHRYLEEQDPTNSTIDLKLKYIWANDPAMIVKYEKTKQWGSFCEISDMCDYDPPVMNGLGPDIPKPPKIDMSKNMFWSASPTPKPTQPPSPTSSPTTPPPTETPPLEVTTGSSGTNAAVGVVGVGSLAGVFAYMKYRPTFGGGGGGGGFGGGRGGGF